MNDYDDKGRFLLTKTKKQTKTQRRLSPSNELLFLVQLIGKEKRSS